MPSPSSSPIPSTFRKDRDMGGDRMGGDRMGGRDSIPAVPNPQPYINEEDEKMDLLIKLRTLEGKGVVLSRSYNMKSSLEDIKIEYKNQTAAIQAKASINFYKTSLIYCVNGIEYMNRRFDPIGANLDDWGSHVMESIDEYEVILEKIHEKYGSMGGDVDPIIRLIMALGFSAGQYHFTNTMFKNAIPQFGQVLRENPAVVNGLTKVAMEAANRSKGMPSGPVAANDTGGRFDIGSVLGALGINGNGFGNQSNSYSNTSSQSIMGNMARAMSNPPPMAEATREKPEPAVNDLYRQMVKEDLEMGKDSQLKIERNGSDRKAVISPMKGGGKSIMLL
jgi:hypothetical protein